jgi:RNA polymerase sigma factor (TIGR02999 family)
MHEVTQLLQRLERGESQAAAELLPLVYDELRSLAASKLRGEAPGHTLQATALVHEAWLRIAGTSGEQQRFDHRGHFFAAAAEAMRRILVDSARRKGRLKRGRDHERVDLDDALLAAPEVREDLVALDEALTRLQEVDPPTAKLVQLRYFAGLTMPEAARILGVSPRTADRLWSYAKAWLHREIGENEKGKGQREEGKA